MLRKNKKFKVSKKANDLDLQRSIQEKLKSYQPPLEQSDFSTSVKYDGPMYEYDVKEMNFVQVDEQLEESLENA